MAKNLHEALASFGGRRLSDVVFVEDYVQLEFHQARLTSYTPPTAIDPLGSIFSRGQAGYEHALRSLIGARLESVEVIEKNELNVRFENGASVRVSLTDADYRGPEAFMLTLEDGTTWVY